MKGIYVCMFKVEKCKIKVGALGEIFLEKGLYLYVGSGQRSLESRVKRHKIPNKQKLHWHIDYVSNIFPAAECYVLSDAGKDMEEKLAGVLNMLYPSVEGFGSNDTQNKSHFFKVDENIKNVLKNFAKLWGLKWKKV